jgi:hypothetical protein
MNQTLIRRFCLATGQRCHDQITESTLLAVSFEFQSEPRRHLLCDSENVIGRSEQRGQRGLAVSSSERCGQPVAWAARGGSEGVEQVGAEDEAGAGWGKEGRKEEFRKVSTSQYYIWGKM